LYYLAWGKTETIISRFRLILSLFFLILLLFCASKLFIVLSIPALAGILIKFYPANRSKKKYLFPILVLFIILVGATPFLNRLGKLKNTDFSVVRLDEYQYDTPFNGLTFRLVLWRLAGKILEDKNVWLTGTGIGSRQGVLDSYYSDYGIYTGNPDLGDKGYLGYNFHNQYLEVLVGTGIPGLLLLASIIILIFSVKRGKLLFPFWVYVVMICFFITESVLERQAGLVFFCLLWCQWFISPKISE
jgi:O-antigen ligase